MTFNTQKFDELVNQKYLTKKYHPTEDLIIYNYTNKTTHEGFWTNETLIARGLITTTNGKIVSRPFRKFFSINEHCLPRVPKINLEQPFTLFQKFDGSLGISYFSKTQKPYIATRGSFISKQAQKSTKLLHKILKEKQIKLDPNYTYLFEIIYPENQIIINYEDKEDLILLAIIETKTGKELQNLNIGFTCDTNFKKYFSFNKLNEIINFCKIDKWKNKERYVVRFEDGNRLKI